MRVETAVIFFALPVTACIIEPPPEVDPYWGPTYANAGGNIDPTTGSSFTITTGSAGSVTTGGFGGAGGGPSKGDAGFFGTYDKPVTVAATPPPPVSGGTLTMIAQGHKAAVADSERDQVVIVDLDDLRVDSSIALEPRDEPGRLVEDGAGRLHVALRGSGAVATLDPTAGTVVARHAVCPYPRGLAYDAVSDVVHVACVGGELVTLQASGGARVRRLLLDRDLRDIVIDQDRLLVSRFRAAELLVVEADGRVSDRLRPSTLPSLDGGADGFTPAVAWRTIAAPGGGALMVFQEEQVGDIVIQPGGYGGGRCGGIVKSAVSRLRVGEPSWTSGFLATVLPVDIAASGSTRVAVAGAGVLPPSGTAFPTMSAPVVRVDLPGVVIPPPPREAGSGIADAGPDVRTDAPSRPGPCVSSGSPDPMGPTQVQAVAVAFDAMGRLVVQTRDPALVVNGVTVKLPGAVIADTGHELFHLGTFAGIACASCHPEGHEDGHTWRFANHGARRTQPLRGGILGTEPFHWAGDMANFTELAHQVFNSRMSGPSLKSEHVDALANWIDKLPQWKPVAAADAAAAERGRAIFNDTKTGCAGCHLGPQLTNNRTIAVGTGEPLQVPSLLGLGYRAPYLHNGCATTLEDRFGSCGGGDAHGVTSALSPSERADLVAYLGTL